MDPTRLTGALAVLLLLASVGRASQETDALDRRVQEVAASFSAQPSWSDDHFAPAFLESVPAERMRAILGDFHGKCGAVVSVLPLERETPFLGSFLLVFERHQEATLRLGVEPAPPHSVTTWIVGAPQPSIGTFEELGAAIARLPGVASLCVMRLGQEEPEVLLGIQADTPLAIGSAFKLYVLGALLEDIVADERGWGDPLALDPARGSLPSGFLHSWPAGSLHTLETLAGLMISQSDNTATDHLLAALGRERVEAMLERMGNAHAQRSLPLLSTSELFKLKWVDAARHAQAYAQLGLDERRAFLRREVAALSLQSVDLAAMARPIAIDTVEWFASTADLCRAMDWLRRHTQDEVGGRARALLAIQPGAATPRGAFDYVGFKGGSEPGVLNLTWLLRARDGAWLAVAATWNDPGAVLSEGRLVVLAGKALVLLAERVDHGEGR